MPFLSHNVSYSKYCVKHCWHLPPWLLDVCLIHNAFLSAINRLWEFDTWTHAHQTTGDTTITLVLYVTHTHTHSFCSHRTQRVTTQFAAVALSLIRSSWEKHLVTRGAQDNKHRESPEQQSSQSDTSCMTSIYEKRSADCHLCHIKAFISSVFTVILVFI